MKRVLVSLICLAVGACLFASVARADDFTLRVGCYGGAFTKTQEKYAGSIFTLRTGIKIDWIDGNPTDQLAKMIASRGRDEPFDVVYLDEYTQADAISAGTLMKLDPNIVTNLRFIRSVAKNPQGYGPAFLFWATGIVYNTKLFKENGIAPPTSWKDLWNPKLAGKIALPDISQTAARDLIIAAARLDGGDESHTGDAFKKLGEIQPLYYYRSSADLESKLTAGEVWVTVWNNARPANLEDHGVPLKFVYPVEKGFEHVSTVDVVAGTPHAKAAMMFVNQVLDPLAELGQANEVPYGPTNELLIPILDQYPALSSRFPYSDADLAKLYKANVSVVNAAYPQWVNEWNHVVKH